MESKNNKNDENSSSSFSGRVQSYRNIRLKPFQDNLKEIEELDNKQAQNTKKTLLSKISWKTKSGNEEHNKALAEKEKAENRLKKEEKSFRGALSDRGHALYDMVKENLKAAWRSIVQGFTSLMGSGNTITVPNEEQDSVPSNSLSIEGGQNSDEKIMAYLGLNYPELKYSGKKGIEKLVENLRTSVLQIKNDNGAEDESKDRINRVANRLHINGIMKILKIGLRAKIQ